MARSAIFIVAVTFTAILALALADTSALRHRIWTQNIPKAPLSDSILNRYQLFLSKNNYKGNDRSQLDSFRENIARIVQYNQLAREDPFPVPVLSTTGPFVGMTNAEYASRLGLRITPRVKRSLEQSRPAVVKHTRPVKKSVKKPAPVKKPATHTKKPVPPVKKPVQPVQPNPTAPVKPIPKPFEPVPEPLPKPKPVVVEPIAPPVIPRPPVVVPVKPVVLPPPPPPPNYDLDSTIVDWRTSNVLAPIQDQFGCGGCWAYSAVAVLEAAYAIRDKRSPVKLSEQFLIDCSKTNEGCDGGSYITAVRWIQTQGIAYASAYPNANVTGTCAKVDASQIAGKVKGYNWIRTQDVNVMMAALKLGPITAGVEASGSVFQFYKHGVITDKDCDVASYGANHAIVIVGAGVYQGVDVWVIRNSYGTKWGMGGYGYIERGKGKGCGINLEPMSVMV